MTRLFSVQLQFIHTRHIFWPAYMCNGYSIHTVEFWRWLLLSRIACAIVVVVVSGFTDHLRIPKAANLCELPEMADAAAAST